MRAAIALTPQAAATFRFERMRAVATGVLETAAATFLQLIALRWFHAEPWVKAIIVGGGSIGLMLSPISVSIVGARRWSPSRAAAVLAGFGAVCHAVAAAVPWLPLYTVCVVTAMTSYTVAIPLVTHMYQENYPPAKRGQLFSRTVMLRIGAAAAFGWIGGWLLNADMANFRWMLLIFSFAMAFGAWCLWQCPTSPLENSDGSHPFRALKHAWNDKLFQRTLVCWMLMGFANLMMLPMRIEYLGNPRHGLNLSADEIALLTLFLPNLARLALSPLWGRLFDRMNFFALRIVLNIGFALGILTFFTSDSWPGLVLAALVYGVSSAGGDVAWSLWVIKFAPPGRVAEYMAVHTFFTGVRGVIAPFAAYLGVTGLSIHTLAWISVGLIAASAVLLWPEIQFDRKRRAVSPVTEDVAD